MTAARIIAPPLLVLLTLAAASCRQQQKVTRSYAELQADSVAFVSSRRTVEVYDSLMARLEIAFDSVSMEWPDGRRLMARRATASAAQARTVRVAADSLTETAVSAHRHDTATVQAETPRPRTSLRHTLLAALSLAVLAAATIIILLRHRPSR